MSQADFSCFVLDRRVSRLSEDADDTHASTAALLVAMEKRPLPSLGGGGGGWSGHRDYMVDKRRKLAEQWSNTPAVSSVLSGAVVHVNGLSETANDHLVSLVRSLGGDYEQNPASTRLTHFVINQLSFARQVAISSKKTLGSSLHIVTGARARRPRRPTAAPAAAPHRPHIRDGFSSTAAGLAPRLLEGGVPPSGGELHARRDARPAPAVARLCRAAAAGGQL